MSVVYSFMLISFITSSAMGLDFELVSREEWGARIPKDVEPMDNPVPYVVIHHSYSPKACYTNEDCVKAMRGMQNYHMDDRGWSDIGYSFAVGGDGRVYTGRGFSRVGAHAPKMNHQSIGICLIGDWSDNIPPPNQLEAVKQLINFGIDRGMIKENYALLGHRQVRDTECPGETLFQEIKTWPHFEKIEEIKRDSHPTGFHIVSRDSWGARPPKLIEHMQNPVPYVVIHHSYIPKACESSNDCAKAMQSMQIFHQDDRGWNDIGYSFGVGGDGQAYVGRGWDRIGAHAPGMNSQSIGICLIGDWTKTLPPKQQLETVKKLIEFGVQQGKIKHDYVLICHRQVRDTECPGQTLFDEIKKWDHFSENPDDIHLVHLNQNASTKSIDNGQNHLVGSVFIFVNMFLLIFINKFIM